MELVGFRREAASWGVTLPLLLLALDLLELPAQPGVLDALVGGGSRRYRYDLAGQLLQACTYQGTPCIGEYATTLNQDAYGYDATGNRKDPSIGAVIGAGNRMTWFKGYSIGYDADGNIISKSGNGEVWTYTWDPFDKLTDVKLNGTLVYHLVYDAFGNRVARCTNAGCSAGEREINDGSQFVFARDGNNVVTDEYGFYPGGDQPMSLRLPSGRTGVFITDPQLRGTVRAIADADKNATNMEFKTYSISPWGVVPADTGTTTRLRMAGQPYDQGSRLYFMRARYYDPDLGRFLSEDPIGISGGLNLYAYAGNDPVNAMDPTGLCAVYGTVVTMAGDPSTDICVNNSAYGDHGGQLTGIPLPELPTAPNAVPGLAGGGGPGGPGTMGRAPAASCKQLAVRFATDAAIDIALGGFGELAHGIEAIGHANALMRTGEASLRDARAFLGAGNAGSAAVMEANGLRLLAAGGALSAERLGGERLIARGLAGSAHSFATAKTLFDVAVAFIPYGATAVSGYEWVTKCAFK